MANVVYRNLKKESDVDSMEDVEFHPSIEIDEMVYKKVMHWIHKSSFEVSGLGKVVVDKERNTIKVIDAILLKQENTSVTTEIDGAAVGKALYELRETPGDLRWWWHSHVDMDVFWSGTDLSTMKQLGLGGWFVSTVFNKKQEVKSAFIQSAPIRLLADDIDTTIDTSVPEHITEQWDKEYEENVENAECSFPPSVNELLSKFNNNYEDEDDEDDEDEEELNFEEEPKLLAGWADSEEEEEEENHMDLNTNLWKGRMI